MKSFRGSMRQALGILALISCATATAAPVFFDLLLQVDGVTYAGPCAPSSYTFGCTNAPGDLLAGAFAVDQSVLSVDGDDRVANVTHFFMQIGNVVWAQDFASDLAGFRDGHGFSSTFNVDVHQGTITGIRGGVYGAADIPFIDFPPYVADGRFNALDLVDTLVTGTYRIVQTQAVAEPRIAQLFAIGLVGLIVMQARRLRRTRSSSIR